MILINRQNSFKPFGEGWIKKKLDVWMPHNLTMKNLMDQIFIYKSLLKRIIFETAHYEQ